MPAVLLGVPAVLLGVTGVTGVTGVHLDVPAEPRLRFSSLMYVWQRLSFEGSS